MSTSPAVDPERFASVDDLTRWHRELDARGLRSTASPAHTAYVDDLERRLVALGLEVRSEPVRVRRWTASAWSLRVAGEPVRVASYVPYSGATGPGGVAGPLSTSPRAGAISVVTLESEPLREGDFPGLDWDAPDLPVVPAERDLEAPYERVWLSQDRMRELLAEHRAAGALGLVFVVDAHPVEIEGSYLLYDGVLRDFPALVVDHETGAALRAAAGRWATLVLEAEVVDAESRNLVAIVPGASDELVMVQAHTDGTNALADNGPEAIVAMAGYLVGLPGSELPRGIALVLSTGHLTTHTGWGLAGLLHRHREDLVARTVAALSVGHLGARSWRPHGHGYDAGSSYELGCFFASPHRAVVDVARAALDRARVTESLVLRPFIDDETGDSPDGLGWPGDGTALWNVGHLPSASFVTGPGYLLSVMPVLDLIDVAAVRRQSIAFLEAALQLAGLPREVLERRVDPEITAAPR